MSIESRGQLGNPDTGGGDWGLSCIHCLWIKHKIGYWSFLSSPMEEVGLGGENRARLAGTWEGGPKWGKEFSSPGAELFLFLGGVRPSDPEGQDDRLV